APSMTARWETASRPSPRTGAIDSTRQGPSEPPANATRSGMGTLLRTSVGGVVFPEHAAQRVGDLAEGGASAQGLLHRREEVVGAVRCVLDVPERSLDGGVVAIPPQLLRALDLPSRGVLLDLLDLHLVVRLGDEPVDADD